MSFKQLTDKLAAEPSLKSDLEIAFDNVRKVDLEEFKIFGIHNFGDWLQHVEKMLKWRPSENEGGSYVYMHLCLFYIILDSIPDKSSWGQNPIHPNTNPSSYTWLTKWIIGYAKEVGSWMDSPESLDPELIKTFYNSPRYHMQDYEPYPGTFTTFNEFFRRPIKREVRPIASPDDQRVITNPADCTFSGYWPVNSNGEVKFKSIPWSIQQLLDDVDDKYKNKFAGGCFTHAFLGPTDYHRQHAPCDGKVLEAKIIEGMAYLQVKFVNDPVTGKPMLAMQRKPEPFEMIILLS
jgi:phosphatidylserine decarboxylase